jgi:hypothetical protein
MNSIAESVNEPNPKKRKGETIRQKAIILVSAKE